MAAIAQANPLIRRRPRGWARLRDHRTWRRVTLIATSALVAWTAGVHALVGFGSASAEALCPFGGLESLYRYVTSGGRYVPHVHGSNMVLFVSVIVLAVALRSAFCGWLCPLGFLQEVVTAGSRWVQRRVPPLRRAVRALHTRAPWLAVVDRPMRLLNPLFALLGASTDAQLARMVEYLKAENRDQLRC